MKHIKKWAKRNGVSCFRVYDLDIPSYPLCIDIYEDYVHVAEYKAKHKMDEDEYAQWLDDSLNVVSRVLEVPMENIFLKLRERKKGLQQYEKFSHDSFGTWVQELGAKLWVNFTDYVDTGLFLDHRVARSWVRASSKDKIVLNLFSYTGAFSVQAAMGGARSVDTVDMSQTYLSWAEKNMLENGFSDSSKFRFLREDILQWLPSIPKNYYDIIILDPPTFSNSKKMKDVLDIQEDHVWIIRRAMDGLKTDGVLYFSNNFRNFVLDEASLQKYRIQEVSKTSIPEDFRNKNIHMCYKLTHQK
ncbi:MAG: class I SAM-dependent methyltransferase [Chitinophagales bacterium]|nr:class I SAM-dependent methyltransferase [Chitinophagales bacterium]